jgi:hypothetical protein
MAAPKTADAAGEAPAKPAKALRMGGEPSTGVEGSNAYKQLTPELRINYRRLEN